MRRLLCLVLSFGLTFSPVTPLWADSLFVDRIDLSLEERGDRVSAQQMKAGQRQSQVELSQRQSLVKRLEHLAQTGSNSFTKLPTYTSQISSGDPLNVAWSVENTRGSPEQVTLVTTLTPVGWREFGLPLVRTGTVLHETGSNFELQLADWNRDRVLDLLAIKKNSTGSGTTEVHIYNGASNFQTSLLHTGTALHETGVDFNLRLADWNRDGVLDLLAIKKNSTGSGTTEVHIYDGASNFKKALLHTPTALQKTGSNFEFRFADWNRDGVLDLVAFQKSQTGSGSTEVHIYDGASNFQTSLVHTKTALHETGDNFTLGFADWNGDKVLDLVAIKKSQTGSNSTEVHVYDGAFNFQTSLIHTGTALQEAGANFELALVDWNRDGVLDLAAIQKSGTASHSTEVRVYSGAPIAPEFSLPVTVPAGGGSFQQVVSPQQLSAAGIEPGQYSVSFQVLSPAGRRVGQAFFGNPLLVGTVSPVFDTAPVYPQQIGTNDNLAVSWTLGNTGNAAGRATLVAVFTETGTTGPSRELGRLVRVPAAGGNFTTIFEALELRSAGIKPGRYTVSFVALDGLGNRIGGPNHGFFGNPLTIGTVSLSVPVAAPEVIKAGEDLETVWPITNSGKDPVTVRLVVGFGSADGSRMREFSMAAVIEPGTRISNPMERVRWGTYFTISGKDLAAAGIGPGKYGLKFSAYDAAGNLIGGVSERRLVIAESSLPRQKEAQKLAGYIRRGITDIAGGDGVVDLDDYEEAARIMARAIEVQEELDSLTLQTLDRDGDGVLNRKDTLLIYQFLGDAAQYRFEVKQMAAALRNSWDINRDGVFELGDIRAIQGAYRILDIFGSNFINQDDSEVFLSNQTVEDVRLLLRQLELFLKKGRFVDGVLFSAGRLNTIMRGSFASSFTPLILDYIAEQGANSEYNTKINSFGQYITILKNLGRKDLYAQMDGLLDQKIIRRFDFENKDQFLRRKQVIHDFWQAYQVLLYFDDLADLGDYQRQNLADILEFWWRVTQAGYPPQPQMIGLIDFSTWARAGDLGGGAVAFYNRITFISIISLRTFIHETGHILHNVWPNITGSWKQFIQLYDESQDYEPMRDDNGDFASGFHPNLREDFAELNTLWGYQSKSFLTRGLFGALKGHPILLEKILYMIDNVWPQNRDYVKLFTIFPPESEVVPGINASITTEEIPIYRDKKGRISRIILDGKKYEIEYNVLGRITVVKDERPVHETFVGEIPRNSGAQAVRGEPVEPRTARNLPLRSSTKPVLSLPKGSGRTEGKSPDSRWGKGITSKGSWACALPIEMTAAVSTPVERSVSHQTGKRATVNPGVGFFSFQLTATGLSLLNLFPGFYTGKFLTFDGFGRLVWDNFFGLLVRFLFR